MAMPVHRNERAVHDSIAFPRGSGPLARGESLTAMPRLARYSTHVQATFARRRNPLSSVQSPHKLHQNARLYWMPSAHSRSWIFSCMFGCGGGKKLLNRLAPCTLLLNAYMNAAVTSLFLSQLYVVPTVR
jgi:hypothetical protein